MTTAVPEPIGEPQELVGPLLQNMDLSVWLCIMTPNEEGVLDAVIKDSQPAQCAIYKKAVLVDIDWDTVPSVKVLKLSRATIHQTAPLRVIAIPLSNDTWRYVSSELLDLPT